MNQPGTKKLLFGWSVLAAILLPSIGGCMLFPKKPLPDYRTVEGSSVRDTAAAEREHKAALAILDCCQQPWCCPVDCGCIRGQLCSIHKAEQHLQNALIADVRYGPAHNTLGKLYFSQDKLYLAAWEFDYAMRLMKGRPEPLNNMGLVYEAAGQNERAAEMYAQAYQMIPDSPQYIGNLARAQLKLGLPLKEVRHLLERTVMVDPRPEWVAWASDQLGTGSGRESVPREPFEELTTPPPSDDDAIETIPPGDPGPVLSTGLNESDLGPVMP